MGERVQTLSDEELLAEYDRYWRELDRICGGDATEAYYKFNTVRTAWVEILDRGIDDKRKTLDDKRLAALGRH
ncbi:hypothetical protein N9917_01575 [Deltaproteobacteria bacterium]|nr:hypothetical protein [Deltaproteobacteria bacterium]